MVSMLAWGRGLSFGDAELKSKSGGDEFTKARVNAVAPERWKSLASAANSCVSSVLNVPCREFIWNTRCQGLGFGVIIFLRNLNSEILFYYIETIIFRRQHQLAFGGIPLSALLTLDFASMPNCVGVVACGFQRFVKSFHTRRCARRRFKRDLVRAAAFRRSCPYLFTGFESAIDEGIGVCRGYS